MTPERRTNIILLSLLAIMHLSTGVVSRQFQELGGWLIGAATILNFAVMFFIYLRFNSDRASLLQTFSYWGIFCTYIVTQRIGMILDKTDLLQGTAIRLLIVVPIYVYAMASRGEE